MRKALLICALALAAGRAGAQTYDIRSFVPFPAGKSFVFDDLLHPGVQATIVHERWPDGSHFTQHLYSGAEWCMRYDDVFWFDGSSLWYQHTYDLWKQTPEPTKDPVHTNLTISNLGMQWGTTAMVANQVYSSTFTTRAYTMETLGCNIGADQSLIYTHNDVAYRAIRPGQSMTSPYTGPNPVSALRLDETTCFNGSCNDTWEEQWYFGYNGSSYIPIHTYGRRHETNGAYTVLWDMALHSVY